MENIIEANNIVKYYGEGENKTVALDGVNMNITKGEFLTIMGPSGSGKSTLLFSISGMDDISSGEVLFNGSNLSKLNEEEVADIRRLQMGFVFQEATMLKNLDVLDNIILPSYDENRKNKVKLISSAKHLMDSVGISGLENRNIKDVSGGQLQRASICRAILHEPEILFGDEPTGALNSKNSEEIMNLFQELNDNGMTIMLVTHDSKVAAKSNRVLMMKDGKVEGELQFQNESFDERLEKITNRMMGFGI
ncbi:ABC transporter ATP-binding protein [Microaceticoccus formicicus]|uniref:ABC transporter ATP-binding protein n=1 Tax=Microaceticoccus formicicus TaxID=3118105 RepID=UPI003CD03611|nr:ABC transporter ATP-binding protein [Peptoniphilaceae bacterium AMB_02]